MEQNPEHKEEEMKQLEIILEREKTQKQWLKHGLCFLVLGTVLTVNLLRGSSAHKSPIQSFNKCDWIDWLIQVSYLIVVVLVTLFGVYINKKEQALKIKYNKGIVDSDIRFTGKSII